MQVYMVDGCCPKRDADDDNVSRHTTTKRRWCCYCHETELQLLPLLNLLVLLLTLIILGHLLCLLDLDWMVILWLLLSIASLSL